jgi:hypothetical protein
MNILIAIATNHSTTCVTDIFMPNSKRTGKAKINPPSAIGVHSTKKLQVNNETAKPVDASYFQLMYAK